MNNPLKYTDPTGYQTAAAPGAVSWLGGGGGWGESSGWGNVGPHWSHYMPNVFSDPTYYYYDSQGYYHKGTYFGGDEIVSFNQVMDEYILPNAITTMVFSGSDNNHYQYFRGLFFSDGQRWYVEDGLNALTAIINGAKGNHAFRNANCSAGGGKSIPSSISWANNGASIAAYGATVVGGSVGFVKSAATLRWYANAWRGNPYVETLDIARIGKGLGISTSLLGAGIGIVNFVLSDKSWGDYGQLGVSLLSAGLTLDGITAPAGIGLGIVDAAGGFNSFYNALDIDQQLYKNTGIIMLPPVNGIP